MPPTFALNHIPALLIATGMSFGGILPIFNPEFGVRGMGFPARIYKSKEAQSIMILAMGRHTAIGLALFTFYLQDKLKDVDILLFILGTYVGGIDAYVCAKEGVLGKAVSRGMSGAVIAGIGWFGVTAWA